MPAGQPETAAQAGIWDPALLGYRICFVGACAGALMGEADRLETAAKAWSCWFFMWGMLLPCWDPAHSLCKAAVELSA